jgi:hypothetical protein
LQKQLEWSFMKRIAAVLLILLSLFVLAACAKTVWKPLFDYSKVTRHPTATPAPTPTANQNETFATAAESMAEPHIVVYKSRHVLEVFDGNTLMARMAVALGTSPKGAKTKDGDGKTPEGTYYICFRNDKSKFYKSLVLSYPNEGDALRGLDANLITQAEYSAIADAIEKQEKPPWNTGMGGEIAISGLGTEGAGKTGDWTSGNIAVSDGDMDYLWKHIVLKTEVIIKP